MGWVADFGGQGFLCWEVEAQILLLLVDQMTNPAAAAVATYLERECLSLPFLDSKVFVFSQATEG